MHSAKFASVERTLTQWQPHCQCFGTDAIAIYFTKSRQGLGLGSLASSGDPAFYMDSAQGSDLAPIFGDCS